MPGKHAGQNVKTDGRFRLSFWDEFTGAREAEDFGQSYESVEAARKAAEATWAETTSMSDETNASEIKWEGPIGTCSYETSFATGSPNKLRAFTCLFIVTAH